jgi:hypothetical protein
MTEADWLACRDPIPMLRLLGDQASKRKLRLFRCACVRRIWHLVTEGACRRMVEVAERHAEGLAGDDELRAARERALRALGNPTGAPKPEPTKKGRKESAAAWAALHVATDTVSVVLKACEAVGGARAEEKAAQAALLREVFGNPCCPAVVDPAWLAWNNGTVARIAQTISADRCFDQLPILGDALEEAGCADPRFLGHCRGRSRHVQGCWLVDLLLNKS